MIPTGTNSQSPEVSNNASDSNKNVINLNKLIYVHLNNDVNCIHIISNCNEITRNKNTIFFLIAD
jgi:hypothetical protein